MIIDILIDAITQILAICLTTLFATLAYLLCYYVQRSKFMKNLRRLVRPQNRVFVHKGAISGFRVNEKSRFHRLLNEEEQQIILSQDAKRKLFNGESVRLDAIEADGTVVLSEVGFFDFMTTNLVIKPASRSKRSAFSSLYATLFSSQVKEAKSLERKVKAAIYGQPRRSFDDVIAIDELANIVTVSVSLEDSTGRVLIVRRGHKVAISSGNFATSCTGSVADSDLTEVNPFLSCAKRELKEELDLDCELQLESIVISKQKLQPAVLFSVKLDCTFEEVHQRMINAPDFNEENSELFAVPKDRLAAVVKRYQFTDVAAFQLAGQCNKWWLIIPRSIEKYKLV